MVKNDHFPKYTKEHCFQDLFKKAGQTNFLKRSYLNVFHALFLLEQYSIGLHSVASVFLHMARTLDHNGYTHLVDRASFHHWITQTPTNNLTTPQHCLCGLVTSQKDTEWYMTEELCGTPRGIGIHRSATEDAKDFENAILDVMRIKVNGIKTAFEIANTILRVKHFVRETIE